jgi:hypothetical protein
VSKKIIDRGWTPSNNKNGGKTCNDGLLSVAMRTEMDLKNHVDSFAELAMLNPEVNTKKSIKKARLTLS